MASKLIALIAIQGIVLQTVYSSCVNRVPPNLGPNIIENIQPNQLVYREQALPILPSPCPLVQEILPTPVYQNARIPASVVSEVAYPAITQDGSVANSLAHVLQLLVVSNLLSTTLPGPYNVPAAMQLMPYEVMAKPAFNFIY